MNDASEKNRPLNWMSIVFLVLATNGPLTSLIGCAPYGMAFGNGIGVTGTYLCVGVVYILFAVGFTAMSQYVPNAGALYAYVGRGLGNAGGVGAAFMAITSYIAVTLACYALLGFYTSLFLENIGINFPWWGSTLVTIAVVHIFAIKKIEFNGTVLFALMIVEVALILMFDLKVIASDGGYEHFSLAPFNPNRIFTDGFGASLVFVVTAFMGFETTVIYARDVKNPGKSIPLATYVSVAIIMALYVVSTWLMSNYLGFANAIAIATKSPGDLWFAATEQILGKKMVAITNALLVTSMLAALVSFNNATVRYWYALGRDGIAFNWLARLHTEESTPYLAANMQTLFNAGCFVLFAALELDPMATVGPLLLVPAAIGIVGVQAMTALSVIVYFHRDGPHGAGRTRWVALPLISFVGFCYFIYAIFTHIDLMTGKTSLLVSVLPWFSPVVAVIGALYAGWMRKKRPEVYLKIGRFLNEN